jgi:hypothetical protein
MVYVYRIVTKPLTSQIIPEEVCPNCGKKNCVELTLYMRYVSSLLPIYGMGRVTGVRCTSCNQVIKSPDANIFTKKKYSNSIAEAIRDIRANHKRTAWQLLYPWSFWFVMLIIFAGGLGYGLIQKAGRAKVGEMLKNPQAGDVYKANWYDSASNTIDNENGTLVKLVRMDGDTMFIRRSAQSINGVDLFDQKGWNKLSGFDDRIYKISKSKFLDGADFFEYPDNGNTGSTHIGCIMGKGVSNYSFPVVERE